ncbi:unnamed protein product [Discosporangium mesarthrocarpum]
MMRFLHVIRPIMSVIPEVTYPDRKIDLRTKGMWTMYALVFFMWASHFPLYGAQQLMNTDPLDSLRMVFAARRGTLMELGITPIVTSSVVIQLMESSHFFTYDRSSKEERALFQGAQKMFGILITLAQALAYVGLGMYGDLGALGAGNAILIVAQLFVVGVLIILIDEILQKGYGMGSGMSLFMCTSVCGTVVWKIFSPSSITSAKGREYEGAVVALFHLLITREDKLRALGEAIGRANLPNLINVAATVAVFVVVMYLAGWQVDLPVFSQKYRGQQHKFPIKLFYTSNMPVVLQTALVSNLYLISKLVSNKYSKNILVDILGRWEELESVPGTMIPVSGIAYYVSPPTSVGDLMRDPFHALFYLSFVLTACALFSTAWLEIQGTSSKASMESGPISLDIARFMREKQLAMKGHRDTALVHVLDRYIPTAAAFGGMCIGAISVFGDLFGALGSGTGILVMVTVIHQYVELLRREQDGEAAAAQKRA